MPYPTYDDARSHEKELLRLAQAHKVGEPEPDRPRVQLSLGSFTAWLKRRAPAPSRPARATG